MSTDVMLEPIDSAGLLYSHLISPYVIGARRWNSLPNDFQIPGDIISYKQLI